MTVYQWLSLAGVPSLIVLVFTIVLKKMASRRDKKQEEIRQQNKQLEIGFPSFKNSFILYKISLRISIEDRLSETITNL